MLNSGKWTMAFKPNPRARMRLLCVPYAGSGASMYRDWHGWVRDDVEVVGIQLPGRENRFSEPYLTSVDEIVERIVVSTPQLSDKPFVLFGHSVGALIGFELTRALQRLGGIAPSHLIVSGVRAPFLPRRDEPIHALDHDAFIEKIKHFNGTPKALLQDEELMTLFTPLLRADFAMAETYRYEDRGTVRCPATVLGGDQDDSVPLEDLGAWARVCDCLSALRVFPGDHFFINANKAEIIGAINDIFESLLAPAGTRGPTQAGAAGDLKILADKGRS